MFPNTQNKTEKRRYEKSLGMRLSGSTSLTGRVSSPRRSGTFSPVRNLYPPHNTVMFRHPDYAEDRDSLTSIMDPSGPARVKDPHFAGQNSQTRLKPEPSSDTLWRKINAYKEISIKQAKAAHHEKILISYTEQDKPPSGILRPILNTVTNTIMAPSKCDTDFLTNMRYATEKFCLEITNILNKQWSKQKEQLRTEAKSAKEIVYADGKYLHGNDMKLFQATIKKAEETICREKKKLAQSREWKLNKLKKRPSESHPAEPSYKHVKMTYAAAETTAITRHPTEQLCTSPIWFKRTP